MRERRQKRVVQHGAMQLFAFFLFVTLSVTLLCPGSASAAKRKSSLASSKVSPSPLSYPEEEEPLIDQIAMESNDNAHQPAHASVIAPPPRSPMGYTGFKINPNCKCGKSAYSSTDGNPHPWTAAIFYKTDGKDSSSISSSPVIQQYSASPTTPKTSMLLFCTGSLINDRYVLTASRCVQGLNSSDLEVWLSDKSIWTDYDQPLRSMKDENRQSANLLKKIAVEKIIIHPDFSPSVLDHEIALLRLADPVKLSRRRREDGSTKRRFYTTPVCLPKYDVMSSFDNEKIHKTTEDSSQKENKNGDENNAYIKNVKAIVSSWDKKGRTSYSLVQTPVPIVNGIKKCLELSNNTAVLNDNMICAGKIEENAAESCSMDTGSPLVIYEDGSLHNLRTKNQPPQERIRLSSPVARRNGKEDSRGHYTLVGVSSWLYGCTNLTNVNILYDVIFPNNTAKPQVPGVYHRIETLHTSIHPFYILFR